MMQCSQVPVRPQAHPDVMVVEEVTDECPISSQIKAQTLQLWPENPFPNRLQAQPDVLEVEVNDEGHTPGKSEILGALNPKMVAAGAAGRVGGGGE